MDYVYRRETTRGFNDALAALVSAVECHGFAVYRLHDICAKLSAKGYSISPLVILEIAPAGPASADTSPFMPCRIAVYQEEDVVIAALRPEAYSSEFATVDGCDQRAEVERQLLHIVDAAVGSIGCEELR